MKETIFKYDQEHFIKIIKFLEQNITTKKPYYTGKELEKKLNLHYKEISHWCKYGGDYGFVNIPNKGYTYLPKIAKYKNKQLKEEIRKHLISKQKTCEYNTLILDEELEYIKNNF